MRDNRRLRFSFFLGRAHAGRFHQRPPDFNRMQRFGLVAQLVRARA